MYTNNGTVLRFTACDDWSSSFDAVNWISRVFIRFELRIYDCLFLLDDLYSKWIWIIINQHTSSCVRCALVTALITIRLFANCMNGTAFSGLFLRAATGAVALFVPKKSSEFSIFHFIVFQLVGARHINCIYDGIISLDGDGSQVSTCRISESVRRESNMSRIRDIQLSFMDSPFAQRSIRRPHRLWALSSWHSIDYWWASGQPPNGHMGLTRLLTWMIDHRLISVRHRLDFHKHFIIFRTDNHRIWFMHFAPDLSCWTSQSMNNKMLKWMDFDSI